MKVGLDIFIEELIWGIDLLGGNIVFDIEKYNFLCSFHKQVGLYDLLSTALGIF